MKTIYILFFFFLLGISIVNAFQISPDNFNTNLYAGESVIKYFNLTNNGNNNFTYNLSLISSNPNITCFFDNNLNFIQLNISKDEKIQSNFTIKANPSNAGGNGNCKFDIVFEDLSIPQQQEPEKKKPREIWGGSGGSGYITPKPVNQTNTTQPEEPTKTEEQPKEETPKDGKEPQDQLNQEEKPKGESNVIIIILIIIGVMGIIAGIGYYFINKGKGNIPMEIKKEVKEEEKAKDE